MRRYDHIPGGGRRSRSPSRRSPATRPSRSTTWSSTVTSTPPGSPRVRPCPGSTRSSRRCGTCRPQAPGVDLVYAKAFLDDADGFGAGNPSELLLALAGPPPAVDFSGGSDRSGGFLTPNLLVRGVSRSLGAVGENGTTPGSASRTGSSTPRRSSTARCPSCSGCSAWWTCSTPPAWTSSKAPEFVTEALDTVSAVVSEADRLRTAALARRAAPRRGDRPGRPRRGAQRPDSAQGPDGRRHRATGHRPAGAGRRGGRPARRHPARGAPTGSPRRWSRWPPTSTGCSAPSAPRSCRPPSGPPSTGRPQALATLAAAADTIKAVADFAQNLLSPGTAVTARFEWRPGRCARSRPGAEVIIIKQPEKSLHLDVEVRASATAPPAVDIVAEIVDFDLNLMPGGAR